MLVELGGHQAAGRICMLLGVPQNVNPVLAVTGVPKHRDSLQPGCLTISGVSSSASSCAFVSLPGASVNLTSRVNICNLLN
jgi:hypothetical protein